MAYTPEWEPIGEARQRIVEIGLTEEVAGRDLCRAIEEGRVKVRQLLAPPNRGLDKQWLDHPKLVVPADLSLSDIDWKSSKPKDTSKIWSDRSRASLETGLMHYDRAYRPYEGWTVARIDVGTEDVTRIFVDSKKGVDRSPPGPGRPEHGDQVTAVSPEEETEPQGTSIVPAKEVGPLVRSSWDAIKAIWPHGIPEGLNAKERNRKIQEWQKAKGLSAASPRVIQRAISKGRR